MTKNFELGASDSPPDHEAGTVAVDGGRRQIVTTSPGVPVEVNGSVSTTLDPNGPGACVDLTEVANSQAITASSVGFMNPHPGGWFYLMAVGGTAYLLGSGPRASNDPAVFPTATTTVTTGYALIVPEGMCIGPIRIGDRKLAVIGAAAAGVFTMLHITPAANPR